VVIPKSVTPATTNATEKHDNANTKSSGFETADSKKIIPAWQRAENTLEKTRRRTDLPIVTPFVLSGSALELVGIMRRLYSDCIGDKEVFQQER